MFGLFLSGADTLGMPSCLAGFSYTVSWNFSVLRSWPFPVERCLGATGAEGQRQLVHRNDDLATRDDDLATGMSWSLRLSKIWICSCSKCAFGEPCHFRLSLGFLEHDLGRS